MDWMGLEKIAKKFDLFGIQTHPIPLNPHGLRASRTSPKGGGTPLSTGPAASQWLSAVPARGGNEPSSARLGSLISRARKSGSARLAPGSRAGSPSQRA
jgi:hypothetical protein